MISALTAVGAWSVGNTLDINKWPIQLPEVVLFMPGRLLELQRRDETKSHELRTMLTSIPQVLVYISGIWNATYNGDLAKLCAEVGLPEPAILHSTIDATIGIITQVN